MGRYAIVLSAVMIEPCGEKKTCLQRVELPLLMAIISVYLAEALMWILEASNGQCAHNIVLYLLIGVVKRTPIHTIALYFGAFKD